MSLLWHWKAITVFLQTKRLNNYKKVKKSLAADVADLLSVSNLFTCFALERHLAWNIHLQGESEKHFEIKKKAKADIFLLSAPWVEVLSERRVLRRLSGREWLVTARSLLNQREKTKRAKLCSTETAGRKWKSHSDADKSDSPLMYFGNSAAFGKAWKGCVEKGNALSEQYFNWQWPENRSAVFHHSPSPCFSYIIFSPKVWRQVHTLYEWQPLVFNPVHRRQEFNRWTPLILLWDSFRSRHTCSASKVWQYWS